MTQKEKEIDGLQQDIAKLTGRLPVSRDEEYLRRRLAELKQAKKNGEETKRERAEASTVLSVSLPISAKDAVLAIADKEKCGNSALVRLALAQWCERNGYKEYATTFINEDD